MISRSSPTKASVRGLFVFSFLRESRITPSSKSTLPHSSDFASPERHADRYRNLAISWTSGRRYSSKASNSGRLMKPSRVHDWNSVRQRKFHNLCSVRFGTRGSPAEGVCQRDNWSLRGRPSRYPSKSERPNTGLVSRRSLRQTPSLLMLARFQDY